MLPFFYFKGCRLKVAKQFQVRPEWSSAPADKVLGRYTAPESSQVGPS